MNIIELARQAGFQNIGGGIRDNGEISDYWDCWPEQLERFAALVREECAKVCDELLERETMSMHASHIQCLTARGAMSKCAAAIRAMKDE